ncbi:MAG: [Selenomonadaceae bacterium]|nr:[citrate (pro-3S)-lyase] ligase [Selenomonadaceae bacterium]
EGYFNKENLQDKKVDSSQDVEIFGSEIAPSLGINIRFVGEEPEDSVTRQYNENMKNILPRYDVDFCEIPRREINGEVISAKIVRAALKAGDFDKVKKLVPSTTYDYLREKFK